MYSRILATLDGSPRSEQVLPELERLMQGTDAIADVLIVSSPPKPTIAPPAKVRPFPALVESGLAPSRGPRPIETVDQAIERVTDELTLYLDSRLHSLREKGLEIRGVVRFGDPAEEIIRYARSKDVDLIMMASHGRTGLPRVIFGSVAARVLESGVKPVLLIRDQPLE